MSPTSGLYLFAGLALAAVILQLPKRLVELVEAAGRFASWAAGLAAPALDYLRSAGQFPEYIDSLLRDEGRRAVLEPEYAKLRRSYKTQQQRLATLRADLAEVCKEHYRRWCEFPFAFPAPGRQPKVVDAEYRDTEWAEPPTIVKMFYATDLKTVFLCAKIKQLRSAVLANATGIRQLSDAIDKEQQVVQDLIGRIEVHKKRLRLEEAKKEYEERLERAAPWLSRGFAAVRRDLTPWSVELPRAPIRRSPRPVRRELPELPLHAAARAAREIQPIYPQVAPNFAPGPLFPPLQHWCPQEDLVPAPAPAPETIPFQHAVLAPPAEPETVDIVMVDAPDLVEDEDEVMDVSMVDIEMADAVVEDVEMVDAPYEPLLCQGSPTPALSALPPCFSPVSTDLADTAMEVEQEPPRLTFPTLPAADAAAFVPPPTPKDNAQLPVATSGSRPSSSLVPPTELRLSDDNCAMVEQPAPAPEPEVLPPPAPQQQHQQQPQQQASLPAAAFQFSAAAFSAPTPSSTDDGPAPFIFGLTAPAHTQPTAPAAEPATISFSFEAREPLETRAGGRYGLAAAAFVAQGQGEGQSLHASPEAEPTRVATPPEAPSAFVDDLMPGEILRSVCEDLIVAGAAFMNASPAVQCGKLSPSWVKRWQQSALVHVGEELGPNIDELEFEHDEAAATVKRLLHYSFLRFPDGPDTEDKNAVFRHMKELAAEEGLDLGRIEV
ncbi:a3694021-184f-46fc-84fe-e6b2db09bcc8 [Thermothielavioides terrestris]|uniref:A3694021-184f-46fc-84fe-e6b2db09bcc8 n=1 Tax=Thermothielavioides terrestris TaxID=2587410 RepID=A0A446BR04_9PEZI|nr:a3694021-184f-46fc-84fe-e6b2db09bcc8 [Thermothielavioides terrestris]